MTGAHVLRLTAVALVLTTLAPASPAAKESSMQWRQAGLDEREAAAHLVSRFTFGATPGLVERVVEVGLETWFARQLDGPPDPPNLEQRLSDLRYLDLSEEGYGEHFPSPGLVVRRAQERGLVSPEISPQSLPQGLEKQTLRRKLVDFADSQGYHSQGRLVREVYTQKLLRAVLADSQLHEVLTDFWFNHFNVARSERQSQPYLLAYERDAIRPYVTADFRQLLGATAPHPAMLFYLDNDRSTADVERPTTAELQLAERASAGDLAHWRRERSMDERRENLEAGLNENYARELLELHTLGVEGGYSQQDVVEVARAFTGWTALKAGFQRTEIEARLQRAARADVGFVFEGSFVFRADRHDAASKRPFGRRLPAGRGIEDGEEVLDLLAAHPSTAAHLSLKLARRFIADEPPAQAVEALAKAYLDSGGDLRVVLTQLVSLPEFWDPVHRGAKIKSPFELAASALRVLDADVRRAEGVIEWVARMGQPLYDYQAPTGFPDRASQWVNTGSLLNRMNFGLALASGRVAGVRVRLTDLLEGREPESRSAALEIYLALLLPNSPQESTVELLLPMIDAPDLESRLDRAAPTRPAPPRADELDELDELFEYDDAHRHLRTAGAAPPAALAQVVGVILGSPDFQRR